MFNFPFALPSATNSCKRMMIDRDPYQQEFDPEKAPGWKRSGQWPCRWINCELGGEPPFLAAYRLHFELDTARTIRIHVTADERYVLYLNGTNIGRGSERGEPNHWFFETYDLTISAGRHLVTALVWSQGKDRAFAQMSVAPGFLLSPQDEEFQNLLGTGLAAWEAKRMDGFTYTNPMSAWGTGQNMVVDGSRVDWNFAQPEAEGWRPAHLGPCGLNASAYSESLEDQHLLLPAVLPPMMEEEKLLGRVRHLFQMDPAVVPIETARLPILESQHQADKVAPWQALFTSGKAMKVPPNTTWRVLLDLEDYYCAYPRLTVSGGKGAFVRIHWQEALLESIDSGTKGHRDQIEGKYFATLWWKRDGLGDSFHLDGGHGRTYEPLWWQAGRYVEIIVSTEAQELTIERLSFVETRYPMENESTIRTSREEMNALVPIFTRSLHVCSHETYVDCPYFEQLCYVGDSRLDSLITFVTSSDSRLPRKTLRLFDWSRIHSGLTQSRFPSRVRQIIPPFSLWWICMVYDYALWRGEPAFIRSLMPGVRAVLEVYRGYQDESGIVTGLPGWNFVDWVKSWDGEPPAKGEFIPNGTINWQLLLATQYAAKLEHWLDEPDLARHQERHAKRLAASIYKTYWNKERRLYAENKSQTVFSAHSQTLALISGCTSHEQSEHMAESLLHDRSLVETTLYFRHYLFEGLQAVDRGGKIPSLLGVWLDLPKLGFKTTYETHPSTTRSDCHSWGAHPLYHYFATLAGIRPGSFGFDEISITPALEELGWIEGDMPHPRGTILFQLEQDADTLSGTVVLPPKTSATVHFEGTQQRIVSGSKFRLESKRSSAKEVATLDAIAS